MKQFRKTKDNRFICEECSRSFLTYQGLRNHLRHSHKNLSQKNYFDKWLKSENDSKCKICGKPTKFDSLLNGYKECCNKIHTDLYAYKKKAKTMKEKYGYENQYQRDDVKNKNKAIHIQNLGVENPRQSKAVQQKAKNTSKEKYDDENYNNSVKRKETTTKKYGYDTVLRDTAKMRAAIIDKYGVENVFQSSLIKDKIKQTNIKKYGVDHPSKNEDIHKKQQRSGFLSHNYKNTNLYYRGSFELNFLERYYDMFEITNAPTFKYIMNNISYSYFPDFYIESLNLIIEIKSSWIIKKQNSEKIKMKEKTVIEAGYNYILILDKNYASFEKLINKD